MREFFEAVDSDIGKALFMFYAVSGLRKNEALSLSRNDIDFGNRMVTPKCHSGSTKHSYVSFYNEEAEVILENVVGDDMHACMVWKVAKDKTGIRITPKMLRDWFCEEMHA